MKILSTCSKYKNLFLTMVLKAEAAVFWKFCKTFRNISVTELTVEVTVQYTYFFISNRFISN